MLNLKKYLFASALLFGCFDIAIFALDATTTLIKKLDAMTSLEANFEQTTLLSRKTTDTADILRGKIWLVRPGKFKWKITSPDHQLILINGNELIIFDRDLEQLTRRKVNDQQLHNPALLLSSSSQNIARSFKITKVANTMNLDTFSLVPMDKNGSYLWIELAFRSQELHKIRVKNNLEQITTIKFTNVKINGKIRENNFKLVPPPGTDILDER